MSKLQLVVIDKDIPADAISCGGRFDALSKRDPGADVYHAVQAGKETEKNIKNPPESQ